jgi:hypothetical protein
VKEVAPAGRARVGSDRPGAPSTIAVIVTLMVMVMVMVIDLGMAPWRRGACGAHPKSR